MENVEFFNYGNKNLINDACYTNRKLHSVNQMLPSAGIYNDCKCPEYGSHVVQSQQLLSFLL